MMTKIYIYIYIHTKQLIKKLKLIDSLFQWWWLQQLRCWQNKSLLFVQLIKHLPNLDEKNKEKPLCYPYSVKARALLHAHFQRLDLPPDTLAIGRWTQKVLTLTLSGNYSKACISLLTVDQIFKFFLFL